MRPVLLPILLLRPLTPSAATHWHLAGSHLDSARGTSAWGSRASELPDAVRQDVRCHRVPLEPEFEVAVEACRRARGEAATALTIVAEGDGAEANLARVGVVLGATYATVVLLVLLARATGRRCSFVA